MSLITAVLANRLSLSFASLRWVSGAVKVAKGAPFDVTFIFSPCCAIFKYFNRLALSSVMVTSFMVFGLLRKCTGVMYKNSQIGITKQIQPTPSVATAPYGSADLRRWRPPTRHCVSCRRRFDIGNPRPISCARRFSLGETTEERKAKAARKLLSIPVSALFVIVVANQNFIRRT